MSASIFGVDVPNEVLYAGCAVLVGAPYLLLRRGRSKLLHEDKKQGGYGKVPVFKPKVSIKALLADPKGLLAILKYKVGCGLPGIKKGLLPCPPDFDTSVATGKNSNTSMNDDIIFCGIMLDKVSRSFAAVIRQLPVTLALPVCIFYLVLRVLDTVEDDMDLKKFKVALNAARKPSERTDSAESISDEEALDFKFKCLVNFHTLLQNRDSPSSSDFYDADTIFRTLTSANVGEKDEALLLRQFDRVVRIFRRCAPAQRDIIDDITEQMANGMAQYIRRELSDKGTEDLNDYSQYCHYVAGLVGEGLSRLWPTASGVCDSIFSHRYFEILCNLSLCFS